jgi:CheY-like chemotaxis protein
MSKTVLLIESDSSFARDMSAALESRGFGVRTSSEGKEGVELARALRPDCVVLCVELPGLSGYSWCNRLKKDDALKSIPLVITSSEATPETFEQHRKLKTRAEDYLIKPFLPATLVERVGALVGMPEALAAEEELVTLADVELDGPAEVGAAPVEEDADLRMLDEAFDSISGGGGGDEPSTRAPGSPVAEPPLTLLPDADESPAILDLDREMAEALAALAEEASAPSQAAPLAANPPPSPVRLVEPTIEPADEEETPILLEDVEVLPTLDVTDGSLALTLQAAQEEARELREELDRLRGANLEWESQAGAREAELANLRSLLDSSEGVVLSLTGELDAAREAASEASRQAQERASALEQEVQELRSRLDEAERSADARGDEALAAVNRATGLERELEEARSAMAGARSELETLRAEADALRADAETSRAQGEAYRLEAEALREQNEAYRLEAEALREQNEASRLEAEALREQNEAFRLEAGSLRAEGESLRSTGAALRAEGDTVRSELEGLRAETIDLQAGRDALSAEANALRSELEGVRSAAAAAASARSEVEARVEQLAQQLQATQAQAAQHEDRVLRAYQKIKSDEKLREKTRKALAMILQVLEDRSPGDGGTPPATPER